MRGRNQRGNDSLRTVSRSALPRWAAAAAAGLLALGTGACATTSEGPTNAALESQLDSMQSRLGSIDGRLDDLEQRVSGAEQSAADAADSARAAADRADAAARRADAAFERTVRK